MKFVSVGIILFMFMNVSCSSMQRYIVRGKLLCADKPYGNAQIKLIDADKLRYDDLLDEKFSNDNGEFVLDGQITEMSRIDPILKIYHDCSDGLPCQRRWKFALPKSYIIKPGDVNPLNKTMDIGTFNLEIHWHEEKRKCFGIGKK